MDIYGEVQYHSHTHNANKQIALHEIQFRFTNGYFINSEMRKRI